MKTIVHIKWLYLKEGDAIKISDGRTLIYEDYEHTKDGIVELQCFPENQPFAKVYLKVHKEAMLPVEVYAYEKDEEPEPVKEKKVARKKPFIVDTSSRASIPIERRSSIERYCGSSCREAGACMHPEGCMLNSNPGTL